MASGDTIEAEDVIRVSQGDRNALLTKVYRRPEAVLAGSSRRDRHGRGLLRAWRQGWGDFTFIGVPDYARVVSAEPFDIAIGNVTNVAGLVTITAVAHGLGGADIITPPAPDIKRAYIKGLDGLPQWPLLRAGGEGGQRGGQARHLDAARLFHRGGLCRRLEDSIRQACHQRGTQARERAARLGRRSSGFWRRGASGTHSAHQRWLRRHRRDKPLDPIETSGGTYTPGLNALIGDDGPHRSGDRCGGHRRGSVAEAACRPRRRALVRRQSQLEAGGAERSSRS